MSISPILRPRILVMFALSLILAVSAYGFAAANTIESTAVGDKDATISGYDISNVAYTLDTSVNPSTITDVEFDIAPVSGGPAAADARVQLLSTGGWFDCDVASGAATCEITTPVDTSTAVKLRVVASSELLP